MSVSMGVDNCLVGLSRSFVNCLDVVKIFIRHVFQDDVVDRCWSRVVGLRLLALLAHPRNLGPTREWLFSKLGAFQLFVDLKTAIGRPAWRNFVFQLIGGTFELFWLMSPVQLIRWNITPVYHSISSYRGLWLLCHVNSSNCSLLLALDAWVINLRILIGVGCQKAFLLLVPLLWCIRHNRYIML